MLMVIISMGRMLMMIMVMIMILLKIKEGGISIIINRLTLAIPGTKVTFIHL